MSDYRENFYKHYISRFKGIDLASRTDSQSYFDQFEYKFLPLFDGLESEDTILELGCGPGYLLEFLKRTGFTQVKGIDISSEQVELANKRECAAEVADVFEYLEGKHEKFNLIIALDFIEHFHKEELPELTRLIFKSLKKDGRLILQTPNGEGLFPRQVIYGDITHQTIFTPASIQQLLRLAGFENFHFTESDLKRRRGRLLWQLVKFVANTVRRIESGKSQTIWTENMICYCKKPHF